MYHICRSEHAEERQRLIARTFLRLLKNQEFHAIQITALCEAAGIPRKAFYRFFDTREDVIAFYVEDVLRTLLCRMNSAPATRAISIQNCSLIFRFWTEHPDELAVLLRADTVGHFWGALMHFLLEQRVLYLVLTPDSPVQNPELATALATGNLLQLLLYWNYNGRQETAAELGELLHNSLTRPLLPASIRRERTENRFNREGDRV